MHKTFFTVSIVRSRKHSFIQDVVAGTAIWTVLLPLFLLHAWIWVYQEIYFTINGIPKARSRDYISYDRHELSALSWPQKLSCAYCAYANGCIAWMKEVINRTEAYSCAIKHRTPVLGNEHQKKFAPFEDYS